MDKARARELLRICRLGTADADDPEVAEALALAANDPELGQFLREQNAFHSAMRAKLRDIPGPELLREQVLAKAASMKPSRKPEMILWAIAASVLLLLTGLWGWNYQRNRGATFPEFRTKMVSFAIREYRMDLATNDVAAIRSFLRNRGLPTKMQLPPPLEAMPRKGAADLHWHGKPVAMVCFSLLKDTLYLFVVDRSAVRGWVPTAEPEFVQEKSLATASWSAGDLLYVLAAPPGPVPIKVFFAGNFSKQEIALARD